MLRPFQEPVPAMRGVLQRLRRGSGTPVPSQGERLSAGGGILMASWEGARRGASMAPPKLFQA